MSTWGPLSHWSGCYSSVQECIPTIIGEIASGRPETTLSFVCPIIFYSLLLPFAFLCRPTLYIQRYMYHFCSFGLLLGAFRLCTAAMSILYFVFAIGALRPPLCHAMFICCGKRFHIWHAGIVYQMRGILRSPFCHCDRWHCATGRFETSVMFVFICIVFPCCLVVATSHLYVFSVRRIYAVLLTLLVLVCLFPAVRLCTGAMCIRTFCYPYYGQPL